MSAPKARRGRSYASRRFPEGYTTWADLDEQGYPIFRGESNSCFARDKRMIARRRLL